MKRNRHRFTPSLLGIAAVTACAAEPPRTPEPVPAGHLYEGGYINVRVPNSDGWHLMSSSGAGMEFARSGAEQGESFGAQVLVYALPQTQSEEQFVALIESSFESDNSSERFSVVEADFQYSDARHYPCVAGSSVVEDRHAQVSTARREKLLLQSVSLSCRHPVRQETGFSIIYSHRGKSLHADLNAEAEDFMAGVQVPEQ